MLLRWARSNVRENLVMISFLLRRFRTGHNGSEWVRLFSATQLVRMTLGEAFKVIFIIHVLLSPMMTFIPVVLGCFSASILPAVVHQLRYGGWFGWRWAIPYSFFWFFCLSWISLWGLATAPKSSWLTRAIPTLPQSSTTTPAIPPAAVLRRQSLGFGGTLYTKRHTDYSLSSGTRRGPRLVRVGISASPDTNQPTLSLVQSNPLSVANRNRYDTGDKLVALE